MACFPFSRCYKFLKFFYNGNSLEPKIYIFLFQNLNLYLLYLIPLSRLKYVLARFAMLLRVSGCSAPSSFFLMSNT